MFSYRIKNLLCWISASLVLPFGMVMHVLRHCMLQVYILLSDFIKEIVLSVRRNFGILNCFKTVKYL